MTAPTNADPHELEKFSQLAHRWWDPNSEFRPLHEINPLRLKWIDARAGLAGKRVLDVGCGGGILSEAMAALGAQVTGIDLSDKALKIAAVRRLHALVRDPKSPAGTAARAAGLLLRTGGKRKGGMHDGRHLPQSR